MSETTGTHKKSFFKGLKSEFKKVVWPDKRKLTRQTIAVLASAVAVGVIISIVDAIIQFGLNFIIG